MPDYAALAAQARKPAPEVTPLAPVEDVRFKEWAKANQITDVDHPESRYDYRGYWKDVASKGADQRKTYSDGPHFPDTYKQHGHPTFSIESKYSKGAHDGGRWNGETYIPEDKTVDYTALATQARQASQPARTPDRPPGLGTMGDFGIGVAKGAVNTVVGLGELVHRVPGVSTAVDAMYGRSVSQQSFTEARAAVQPTNTAQKVGFGAEQIGEFLLPTGAVTRGVKLGAELGKTALLTGAQGGTRGDVALNTGLSAVVPGAGAVKRGGKFVADMAEPLVRSAIKPTVASLRRITGKGGMDAKANALVRFIIDNRLTTPEKALALFQSTEHELQRVLSVKNAPTDAPTRAVRYLESLERSAAKQGLPAEDVAQINRAAAELLEGPMGKDVVTMVPTPHPTLLDASGKPITVLRPHVTRELRTDVMADEALTSARSSGRWTTRKAWGEQKGATTEASKAVERAQRDAAKAAVPEAKALLQTESKAIQAEGALDRMTQRQGNREGVSLPSHVLMAGGAPVLAFASNWLRNNGMKAGIWADSLGKAIQSGNAPMAADILKKLGVGAASQAMRTPATAR